MTVQTNAICKDGGLSSLAGYQMCAQQTYQGAALAGGGCKVTLSVEKFADCGTLFLHGRITTTTGGRRRAFDGHHVRGHHLPSGRHRGPRFDDHR